MSLTERIFLTCLNEDNGIYPDQIIGRVDAKVENGDTVIPIDPDVDLPTLFPNGSTNRGIVFGVGAGMPYQVISATADSVTIHPALSLTTSEFVAVGTSINYCNLVQHPQTLNFSVDAAMLDTTPFICNISGSVTPVWGGDGGNYSAVSVFGFTTGNPLQAWEAHPTMRLVQTPIDHSYVEVAGDIQGIRAGSHIRIGGIEGDYAVVMADDHLLTLDHNPEIPKWGVVNWTSSALPMIYYDHVNTVTQYEDGTIGSHRHGIETFYQETISVANMPGDVTVGNFIIIAGCRYAIAHKATAFNTYTGLWGGEITLFPSLQGPVMHNEVLYYPYIPSGAIVYTTLFRKQGYFCVPASNKPGFGSYRVTLSAISIDSLLSVGISYLFGYAQPEFIVRPVFGETDQVCKAIDIGYREMRSGTWDLHIDGIKNKFGTQTFSGYVTIYQPRLPGETSV